MPRNPPLLPPAVATSLTAWLAIFSITLCSIISRPRPGAAARRGMATTVDATGSAPFGGPADQRLEVELALKQPTDHQPGRHKQQNDQRRDKTSEDGHDAERDPNDHGELGCGHNSRCSFAEECWRSGDARPTVGVTVPTWRPGGPRHPAAASAQARVAEPVDGAGVLSAPVSYSAGRCTSVTFTSTETTSSPVPY